MKRTTHAYRARLLISASSAALLAWSGSVSAADADRPQIWINLGWQYEQVSGEPDPLAPPFTTSLPRPDFESNLSPLDAQNISLFSYGGEGTISFQPDGWDWIFSAGVRYGRSHGRKEVHKTTAPAPQQVQISYNGNHITTYVTQQKPRFLESTASNSETHIIADFQAGKDVGLGLFGVSNIAVGMRFAQLHAVTAADIEEVPTYYLGAAHGSLKYPNFYHVYHGQPEASRSFRGLGPSLSWNGSAPVAGNVEDGEVTLDWGLNAALLFGRQKTKLHHETEDQYYKKDFFGPLHGRPKYVFSRNTSTLDVTRMKSVTVPNLGGFAGFSVRYSDVKFSAGYRTDFFFGAIDGGWDTRHAITRGFFGPFASISVGIGD